MSNTGIQMVRFGRRLLPVLVVVAGGILLAVSYAQTPAKPVSATTAQDDSTGPGATETPAPTLNPHHVTVNGQEVPTDANGSGTMTTPSGDTKVEVSGGQTKVTTNQSKGSTSNTSSGNSNLNVSINSSNTAGSGFGSTQVYGYSSGTTMNGSSSGFSSTNVFSTDSSNVVTTTP